MEASKARASSTKVILGLVVAGLLVFTLPTVLILCIGMLPTIIAYVTDRRKEKYRTLCIGSVNFVGVIPALAKLWMQDHSFEMAFTILGDPFNWMMLLGAASIGWVIFFVAPTFVAMFLATRIELGIERLKKRQLSLEEECGSGVAGKNSEDSSEENS